MVNKQDSAAAKDEVLDSAVKREKERAQGRKKLAAAMKERLEKLRARKSMKGVGKTRTARASSAEGKGAGGAPMFKVSGVGGSVAPTLPRVGAAKSRFAASNVSLQPATEGPLAARTVPSAAPLAPGGADHVVAAKLALEALQAHAARPRAEIPQPDAADAQRGATHVGPARRRE